MKSIILPLLLLALSPVALAEDKPAAPPVKKDCPLCKLPGRAALFAGGPAACPADCTKLCCKGTAVTYLVEGLVCARCTNKVTTALTKIEGVEVESVSHESGQAVLKYDPAKVKPAQLKAAIVDCGYKITGEQVSFSVTGLTDDRSAAAVEKALLSARGIQKIETVCHKSGVAIVTFDSAKTNRESIAALINTSGFKIAE